MRIKENDCKQYDAYLFDMDGTLVNSEPLKARALALACEDYGKKVDFNIYKVVMGESWHVVTGYFFEHAHIQPKITDFNNHFRFHYERLLDKHLELHSNAAEYVSYLKKTGKKCALVSSAAAWMVEKIISQLRLMGVFDIVITREHVRRHKPDPEAYYLAIKKLGLSPERVLIFEDSTAGIKAGLSCGCDVVTVKHNFNELNNLSQSKKVISDFSEMFV